MMVEAGHTADKPLKVKIQVSASGSGQMQPLPMNEYIQESLKQVPLRRTARSAGVEHAVLNWRKGAKDASTNGANGINVGRGDGPFFAMVRFVSTRPSAGLEQLGLLRQ